MGSLLKGIGKWDRKMGQVHFSWTVRCRPSGTPEGAFFLGYPRVPLRSTQGY
jgi:hypothetical protein